MRIQRGAIPMVLKYFVLNILSIPVFDDRKSTKVLIHSIRFHLNDLREEALLTSSNAGAGVRKLRSKFAKIDGNLERPSDGLRGNSSVHFREG